MSIKEARTLVAEALRELRSAADPESLRERRAMVFAHIGYLLESHLDGAPGWARGNWIDGASPGDGPDARFELTEGRVHLFGRAVWSDADARRQWIEPIRATIALDPAGEVSAYEIAFADAELPLGLVSAGRRRAGRQHPAPPVRWKYEFSAAPAVPEGGAS